MNTAILDKDISGLLNLDKYPEAERNKVLEDIGQVVLDATLLRVMNEMPKDKQLAFEHYLETNPEPEALFYHIVNHHQRFSEILDEEIAAFKEETVAVLDGQSV